MDEQRNNPRMRLVRLVPLTVCLLAIGVPGAAGAGCTTSWAKASDGEWNVADNWSNGVPTPSCDAVISVPGNYVVRVGSVANTGGMARSLTIGGTSGAPTLIDSNEVAPCQGCDERLRVGAGGISVTGTGVLQLRHGRVRVTGPVTIDGGRLEGTGTMRTGGGLIVRSGVVATHAVKGDTATKLRILGDYRQLKDGILRADGPAPSPVTFLSVSGRARLGGMLRVQPSTPAGNGQVGVVVAGKGRKGRFAKVDLAGGRYRLRYGPKGAYVLAS